jgi:hypothetical protein
VAEARKVTMTAIVIMTVAAVTVDHGMMVANHVDQGSKIMKIRTD